MGGLHIARNCLNNVSLREYALKMLNMIEYADIFLKKNRVLNMSEL